MSPTNLAIIAVFAICIQIASNVTEQHFHQVICPQVEWNHGRFPIFSTQVLHVDVMSISDLVYVCMYMDSYIPNPQEFDTNLGCMLAGGLD